MYYESLNSLLCTVDELVFIGPLKACFHSFVVPQLLCMIKELLRGIKKKVLKAKKHIKKNIYIQVHVQLYEKESAISFSSSGLQQVL